MDNQVLEYYPIDYEAEFGNVLQILAQTGKIPRNLPRVRPVLIPIDDHLALFHTVRMKKVYKSQYWKKREIPTKKISKEYAWMPEQPTKL